MTEQERVRILKVHDLEKTDRQSTNQKSIAFTAESKDDGRVTKIEENLSLMARNFNKFVKRMEKGGDLETKYKILFDKFYDLSHENLELLKEKEMVKAQINILELDQPSTKTKAYSIDREPDQEVLAMTEQEKVRKEAEAHVQRLSDLLAVETDRSRLLEIQLTENHKKVRMLSAGTDHILTLGQCPSLNIGLGYKGSTSKATETNILKKEKSLMCFSDTESESDSDEVLALKRAMTEQERVRKEAEAHYKDWDSVRVSTSAWDIKDLPQRLLK
ncbi:hypothetical protein DY000_02049608 [Brassica cretica]|uniref:Uncharacterized protein n=1 Tax=Brassica cretica TaxID=69181 RepID=A0ABQ7EVZ4_BRACR|nr:hypothetical protein DY000_02049608 [Brassica cretica]